MVKLNANPAALPVVDISYLLTGRGARLRRTIANATPVPAIWEWVKKRKKRRKWKRCYDWSPHLDLFAIIVIVIAVVVIDPSIIIVNSCLLEHELVEIFDFCFKVMFVDHSLNTLSYLIYLWFPLSWSENVLFRTNKPELFLFPNCFPNCFTS